MTKSSYDTMRMLFRQPRKGILFVSRGWNALKFRCQGVSMAPGSRLEGKVYLRLEDGASLSLGRDVRIVGGFGANRIGRGVATSLSVGPGAVMTLGDGVGISGSCLWARERISIGNHVNIGANCVILDHDAHSLSAADRRSWATDSAGIASAPVSIGDDVLLGARCIVLKGVHIGAGAIVGAGSVVTCDIPSGEVWAGNPARKIR